MGAIRIEVEGDSGEIVTVQYENPNLDLRGAEFIQDSIQRTTNGALSFFDDFTMSQQERKDNSNG